MNAFYLKLCATPILMLLISLAARRWGPQVGGLLSGLPVTSALVILFLSLEQGPAFAAQAVPGALAGVAAVQASYLFYFLVTRRTGAFAGCLVTLALYGAVAYAMSRLGWLPASVTLSLGLVWAIIHITTREPATGSAGYVALPRWVIPMRMLTATLLLLAITASARWLGPVISGLLAPVPVIAWPLAVFAHVQGGRQELAAIVRGNAIGAVGVLGFYLAVHAWILPWGTLPAIGAAVVLAVVVTFLLARVLDKYRT